MVNVSVSCPAAESKSCVGSEGSKAIVAIKNMFQSPTGSGIVNIEHAIHAMTSVCQAVSNRMIVFAC